MGQSWTYKVRRMGILCAVNLSLYLNCFAGVDQGEKKVTLNVVEESCVKVFKQIEKQTKMSFFYSTSDIRLPVKVSIKVVDAALDEVMGRILEGTGLEWIYTDNVITIRKKKGLSGGGNGMGTAVDSNINMITVTGKVVQADGSPIPGATVRVKRTGDGVTTDGEGEFTLAKTKKNDLLIISSIGYETREIPTSGNSVLIKLNLAINNLDETVVIAYGTTTQRYNTGNISSIKAQDIEKQPVSNPLLALQGRVPGLYITQANGLPGGGVTVRIQGQNSIGRGNDPLYVIDGVPYTSQLLPSLGAILGRSGNTFGSENGNPLSYINPADIESIEVLKDADATAIYGSRAANGAILITTKKGKPGEMKATISAQTGWGFITRKLKLLDTKQYLEMRQEAFKNDGLTPGEFDFDINGTWDTTRYTDWQKTLIGNNAKYNDIQTNILGGNTLTQYLLGIGYHRETTVFPGENFDQKWSLHFNVNSTSSNQRFKAQLSGNYINDDSRLPNNDLTSAAITTPPNAPELYHEDGSLNWARDSAGNYTWINPVSYLNNRYKRVTNNLVGNAILSFQLFQSLEIRSSFGFTNQQFRETVTVPLSSTRPDYRPSTLRVGNYGTSSSTSWIIEPQAIFHKAIGKSDLQLLIGTTIQKNINDGQSVVGVGYNSDLVLEDIRSASNIYPISTLASTYKYRAMFGRINYKLSDKYILNISTRRDGSSRFGSENLYHSFASVGTGWIFSNETFFEKKVPFVSFGKLRISYGTTGSDQIGDYQHLDLYFPPPGVGIAYQGATGLLPDKLTNPYLQWEETKKLQFGLDLGFLKDHILFTANFIRNISSNQLLPYTLPIQSGFSSILANFPAKVHNTSIELSITSYNLKQSSFSWTTNFNLTLPKNKLASFPNLENSSYADLLTIGQPITINKTFRFAGVNDSTGIYQFTDNKGTSTSNPDFQNDRVSLVNTLPKFYGGLQNIISFKRIQFDFLFQFVKQIGKNYMFGNVPGSRNYNQPTWVLSRWKKVGDNTEIQKFNQDFSTISQYFFADISDAGYTDASYIRLKNISLSYSLPSNIEKKLHLQNCRMFLLAQNLLTFTKYKGLDPESQSISSIPPLKTITVGLQITL